jgi:hypothetical protein
MSTLTEMFFHHVEPSYRHDSKQARPAHALIRPHIHLKWYTLAVPDRMHTANEVSDAQAFIVREIDGGRLELRNEIGFVVQHRVATADIFYVCSWNDNNELWETHYYRPLATGQPEVGRHGTKFPTFCVWVLSIVHHEMQAWSRYLKSARNDAAREDYANDHLDAMVE